MKRPLIVSWLAFFLVLVSLLFTDIPILSRLVHLLVALLFIALMSFMIRAKQGIPKEPILLIAIVFGLYSWSSAFWAIDQDIALIRALGLWTSISVFILLFIAIRCAKALPAVISAIILAVLVQGLLALFQVNSGMVYRATGLLENANALAMQLSLLGTLMLFVFKRWSITLILFILLLIILSITTTGSRKSLIVLPFFFAMVVIGLRRSGSYLVGNKKKALFLNGVMVVLISGLVIIPFYYDIESISSVSRMERYLFSPIDINVHNSENNRFYFIIEALQIWEENPILGIGLDNFSIVSREGMYSHNNYAELVSTLGLIGLLLYGSVVGRLITMTGVNEEIRTQVLVFIALMLVLDFAMVTFTSRSWWIILAVLTSIHPIQAPRLNGVADLFFFRKIRSKSY